MHHRFIPVLLSSVLLVAVVGCHNDQPDMNQTNRLNSSTSTGNSQQATTPPTGPNGSQSSGGAMQP